MNLDELMASLAADDTTYRTIESDGTTLHLGSLSAGEIFDYFESIEKSKGTPDRRLNGARLLARSLVSAPDASGTRLVKEEADLMNLVALFLKKNPTRLATLVQAVLELNGLGEKDAVAAAKNVSAEGQGAGSPTVLH